MTTYAYTTLDPLGLGSSPIGINTAGDVVGTFNTGTTTDGFVDINGTITDLGPIGTNNISDINNPPLFINASGQVAGVDASDNVFLFSGGISTTIANLNDGGVAGIDAAGEVAYDVRNNQSFLYSNGTAINIGPPGINSFETAINAAGQVTGEDVRGEGFIYSGGFCFLLLYPISMPSFTALRREPSISLPRVLTRTVQRLR
jgi:probable HAF family extracellular repeat protein